ncbi:BatD family protein [Endobacterium cereale]|uniref:BatD family protein n=1 Tax=Endobacterium cereale TaxID=2663029 RepID=UPI0012967E88|nr:BatD family protein [Endobacterium cereale]
MRIVWLTLLLLFPLKAFSAEPYARAVLEDGGKIVPGQQIHVTVDVFAPNFFTSPPQFPLFELPNALVTLPEERSVNLNETAAGIQYSGIRRRYAIVPQIAGDYHVPVIAIELGYSVDGETVRGVAKTAALSFTVEGGPAGGTTFAARNVTVDQAFDRPPASLKVGDAVVRTITITAENTQAVIIAPSKPGAATGLKQYAKAAKTQDGIEIDRRVVSRRTEALVYTATTEGSYSIPAIDYPWFDLERHETVVAHLPATDVTVMAETAVAGIAPDAEPERARLPFEQRRRVMLWIGLFLAAVAAAWALWRFAKASTRWFVAIWKDIAASRPNRIRLLRRAILHESPAEVYKKLQAWSHEEGFRTLEMWAQSKDLDLARHLRGLEALLYSGHGGDFDRKRLARLATGEGATSTQLAHSVLPPLNPAS